MKAVIQRVLRGSVSVAGEIVGEVGRGLVIMLGVRQGDDRGDAQFLAEKCVNLRIFPDDAGRFDQSALDIDAELLVISQFTLYGDCRKGRRPNFSAAAAPEESKPLYDAFVEIIRGFGLKTETGIFAADMQVVIHNDGPVTIIAESKGG